LKKLKICSIACVPVSSVEGPATHVRELHGELAKQGVNIELWLADIGAAPKIILPTVDIKTVKIPNVPSLRYLLYDVLLFIKLSIAFVKKNDRPDALYLRQSYSTILPGLLSRLFKLPLVVELNGFFEWDLISRKANRVIKICSHIGETISYKYAKRIICVTAGIKENVDREFHVGEKTLVIQNGVNTDHFRPFPQEECRTKLVLPPDKIILGYVGCFTPWDGIESVVELAPGILESYPDIRFLLIGSGHCEIDVRRRVKALGLEGFFHFPGFIDNIELNLYISCFDIALAPYVKERNQMGISSLKCLEYFACGIPVVASSAPEMEYIERSGGGILFTAGNNDEFLRQILNLIRESSQRQTMGKAARKYVEKYCSWKHAAQKTVNVLNEACENS
jgi:glycosyltransferase involved in cell wall biosynthesis